MDKRKIKIFHHTISLVCAFLLCGCAHFQYTQFSNFQPKTSRQHLRVVTYNLNWGEKGWKKNNRLNTIRAMQATNADIIFFQEFNSDWAKLLLQHMGHYKYREFCHYYQGRGTAVLSKYPFH